MDLDLATVQAFAVAARELHFGRAAGKLFLTQQGLSKRIGRLEAGLGVSLFVRAGGTVSLTDAGRRFLPHAERLVSLAAEAREAAQPSSASPLRIDVWGHVQQPLRIVRQIVERHDTVQVELSMRRSTAAALDALQRGEIDAAFADVDHLDRPIPPGISRHRVGYERLHAIASVDHPLAGAPGVAYADLARHVMWWPKDDAAPERRRWVTRFARAHRIALEIHGRGLGAEHLVDDLVDDLVDGIDRFSLYGAGWPVPPGAPVRLVPIVDPVPLYPWSLLWLPANTHPMLPDLIAAAGAPAMGPAGGGRRVWTGITDP